MGSWLALWALLHLIAMFERTFAAGPVAGCLLLSAPVFAVWIRFARHRNSPRPFTDVVLGMGASVILPAFLFFFHALNDPMDFFVYSQHSDVAIAYGKADAENMLIYAGYGLLAGGLQGAIYWLLAGRPAPVHR